MNRIVALFSLCALCLVSACSEISEDNLLPQGENFSLKLSSTDIVFTARNEEVDYPTQELGITAERLSWEIVDIPEWLNLSSRSGKGSGKITLTAESYYNFEEDRTGSMRLVSKSGPIDYQKEIKISQKHLQPYTFLSSISFDADSKGDVKVLDIKTNTDWSLHTNEEWIKVSEISGSHGAYKINITVDESKMRQEREGSIKYSDYDSTQVIKIRHSPSTAAILLPNSFVFDSAGEEGKISLDATSNWTFKSVPSWIHLSQTAGSAGVYEIKITATANSSYDGRNAKFYYQDENELIEISVAQGACAQTTISPLSFEFASDGGRQTINLDTRTKWNFTNVPSWVHLSMSGGEGGTYTISISVDPNESYDSRTARFTYKDVNETKEISVVQSGCSVTELSPLTLNFSGNGESKVISLTTYTAWEISNIPDWISLSENSGEAGEFTISVTASANTSYNSRSASLTYIDSNERKRISLSQGGASKTTITPTTLSFIADGEPKTISIDTKTAWRIESVPEWVSLSASSGEAGKHTVTVTAKSNTSYNSRSATLTYTDANESKGISLSQSACQRTSITPAELEYTYSGGALNLSIDTKTSWTISDIPEWLSVSNISGVAGEHNISVTATANLTYNAKSGSLTYKDQNETKTIKVSQEACAATELTPNSLIFDRAGGEKNISLKTKTDWTITNIPDWLTVSRTSGIAGDYTITFKVNANESYEIKSANIVYKDGNEAIDISVVQNGSSHAELTPLSFDFGYEASSQVLSLKTDMDWQITEVPAWISLSQYSGSAGEFSINISVEENRHYTERQAILKYQDKGEIKAITITQESSPNTVEINGESATVYLKNHGVLDELLGDNKFKIKELTIVGEFNRLDRDCLRQMLGAPEYSIKGVLTSLNLKDAIVHNEGSTVGIDGEMISFSLLMQGYENCKNLETIILPDTITHIYGAFRGCTNLKNIGWGEFIKIICDNSFSECVNLSGNIILPTSVVKIGYHAFYGCTGITGVTFSDNLEYIGEGAFYECEFSGNLTIPDNVKTIGRSAFQNCTGITSVSIGENVEVIGDDAFNGCSLRGELIIPDKVTKIGNNAFYNNTGITSIKIGSNVEYLSGFNGCNLRGHIEIPTSVKIIGDNAFQNCAGITSIAIGENVETIGGAAFSGCSLRGELIIPDNVKTIGGSAFQNCIGLTKVRFGANLETIGDWSFNGCENLSGELIIPDKVKYIGAWTFRLCRNLTSLKLGSSVREIKDAAFHGCTGLSGELRIPSSVVLLDNAAFSSCTNLSSIVIEEGVANIGNVAFEHCTGLTGELVIPDSVMTIGEYSFNDITVSSVVLGSNVIVLKKGAFNDCRNLTEVKSKADIPPTIGADCWRNVPATAELLVPASSLSDYQSSDWANWFTNISAY